MPKSKPKDDYYYVGGMLRDELILAIDSLDWGETTKAQAAKIKAALQSAAPHRKGYLFDTDGWRWEDFDFLKSVLVDIVVEDFGHDAMSRGFSVGNTPFGRQIRALREKL